MNDAWSPHFLRETQKRRTSQIACPGANPILILTLILCIGYASAGCSPDSPPETSDYLIRIGPTVLTEADFNQSFEFQKTAYGDSISDPEQLKQLKRDILRELSERIVMLERARETGVQISSKELDAAVQSIQRTYPPGEFEKHLLESGISFRMWREELKTRLIIDKLLQKDISAREIIAPDTADVDRKMKERLQRDGVEATYPSWIRSLRKNYPLEINEAALHHVLDTQPSITSK